MRLKRVSFAIVFVLLAASFSPSLAADDAAGPRERIAAIIYSEPPETAIPAVTEDLRIMRYLLADPMAGDFSLVEIKLEGTGLGNDAEALLLSGKAKAGAEPVSFYYLFGRAGELLGGGTEGRPDTLSLLTGKPKIVVLDLTVPAGATPGDGGEAGDAAEGDGAAGSAQRVRLAIEADPAHAVVKFSFTGTTSEDHSPVRLIVQALRGRSDKNRNRSVTVREFADFLARNSDSKGVEDLGELAETEIFSYTTLEEMAEELGPEGTLALAGTYTQQQRWVDAYLVLREIEDLKRTDPEYQKLSELAQLNLSIEGRYGKDSRGENTQRGVDEGLGFISKMIELANIHYVEDVDNRDLFAGGLRNLELLLENRRLSREIITAEGMAAKGQLSSFVTQMRDRVFEKAGLSPSDFVTRIKRVLMENEATARLPEGVIVTEFIHGVAAALDPNTAFIARNEYKDFQDDTAGHFGGLGIEITLEEITLDERVLTVITPLNGTPAAEAGLLPGDRIIAIEGEPTEGMELMEAVRKLRGPKGTKVTITVVHRDDPVPTDVTITRADIQLESVKGYKVDAETGLWHYLMDDQAGVGYIRLTDFKEDTPNSLDRVVSGLQEEGMKGLVLDLRFNHGGLLTSGVRAADWFLSRGTIVTVKSEHARATPFKAHYFRTFDDFPMVVIVNEQTASAAEILAGALKDHKRAPLVGTRTFGKGTVQTVYELDGGRAAFKLTTAKYYTPSGVCIHRGPYSDEGGLRPDYEVAMSSKDNIELLEVWHLRGLKKDARERLLERERQLVEKGSDLTVSDPENYRDVQLEKALEILRGKLADPGRGKIAGR